MKKKIAVIGLKGLPALGGTAVVGQNILVQLKNDYEFTVYSISSHTSKDANIEGIKQLVFRKFPIKKLNVFYYYFICAFHALFIGKYDLIHLHLIDGAYIVPLLRIRYKVIGTSHGKPQAMLKWSKFVNMFFMLTERIFLRFSSIVTSVSFPLIDEYRKITKREIIYIPNGVNKSEWNGDLKSNDTEEYILFAARRVIESKGCHFFLQALKQIEYSGKVKIIGDMGQVPAYKNLILDLASGLNVEFVGLITDKEILMQYVKNSKLFIFPSLKEAMSMMMLEVASMKAPLICSDIPENTAVFSQNEVTFFKSGNAEDLADKITYAVKNMPLMLEKAEKAYEFLNDNYTWDKISLKYKEVYESIH